MTEQTQTNIPVQSPPVDVFESDEAYLLRADVPGVAQEGVEIEFHKGRLSLVARREQDPVRFERSFRFADRVDADGIEAELHAGVLELRLPKASEARPRKIAIRIPD
jgi:HSP20 family protein